MRAHAKARSVRRNTAQHPARRGKLWAAQLWAGKAGRHGWAFLAAAGTRTGLLSEGQSTEQNRDQSNSCLWGRKKAGGKGKVEERTCCLPGLLAWTHALAAGAQNPASAPPGACARLSSCYMVARVVANSSSAPLPPPPCCPLHPIASQPFFCTNSSALRCPPPLRCPAYTQPCAPAQQSTGGALRSTSPPPRCPLLSPAPLLPGHPRRELGAAGAAGAHPH